MGQPFYLRLIARDALSNDIHLEPESSAGIRVRAAQQGSTDGGASADESGHHAAESRRHSAGGGGGGGGGSGSSASAPSDFRAVLTSATGRSLPASCAVPCGQLEVCAIAFSAEQHTLHVSYGGAAVRRSPKTLYVQPGPLDMRQVTTSIESAEAGRISAR